MNKPSNSMNMSGNGFTPRASPLIYFQSDEKPQAQIEAMAGRSEYFRVKEEYKRPIVVPQRPSYLNIAHLLPFVAPYSAAKEAHLIGKQLYTPSSNSRSIYSSDLSTRLVMTQLPVYNPKPKSTLPPILGQQELPTYSYVGNNYSTNYNF